MQTVGKQVSVELAGRLRMGGRWYNRGDNVTMDENDAVALISRGNASRSRPGSVPKNGASTVRAADVGIVTKATAPVEAAPVASEGADEAQATEGASAAERLQAATAAAAVEASNKQRGGSNVSARAKR